MSVRIKRVSVKRGLTVLKANTSFRSLRYRMLTTKQKRFIMKLNLLKFHDIHLVQPKKTEILAPLFKLQ